MDLLIKENATLKSDLKNLKEQPVFKSTLSEQPLALKAEEIPMNMLSLVR